MGCSDSRVVELQPSTPDSQEGDLDTEDLIEALKEDTAINVEIALRPHIHDTSPCRNRYCRDSSVTFLNCSEAEVHILYRTIDQKWGGTSTTVLQRGKLLCLDALPLQSFRIRSHVNTLLYGVTAPLSQQECGIFAIPSYAVDGTGRRTSLAFYNKTTERLEVVYCLRSREVSVCLVPSRHAVKLAARTGQVFRVYPEGGLLARMTMVATWPPSDYYCDRDDQVIKPKLKYTNVHVSGFNVKVESAAQKLLPQVRKQLESDLAKIEQRLPKHAFDMIKNRVYIYINFTLQYGTKLFPIKGSGVCTHFSRDWLKSVGLNERKAGGIEIQNANDYLQKSKSQPWALLHEFAHVYHYLIGLDHEDIIDTYARVMVSDIYSRVKTQGEKFKKHPATYNAIEYFAELSQTYFGGNNLQPFNAEILKEFDFDGYKMIEDVWEVHVQQ